MELSIKIDDLADGKVITLLEEHHKEMHLYSPPESIHALDKAKFRESSLMFWSANVAGVMAGCGALKQISDKHGEVKSMRTSKEFQRQGIAEKILSKILEESQARKYNYISLETGTHKAFLPAIKLYKKFGFIECGPFDDYELDPHSIFFTKRLEITSPEMDCEV